jgi:CRP-like cAMP-binding protein
VVESPLDRALSLATERDAALRWAAALVRHDPTMPPALCLCGRLLGELNRQEAAREALARAIDLENLPLAVAAARELDRFGGEAYFVARGELDALRERGGEVVVLSRLTNGAMFGQMALLSRAPRTGSVVARRPSILLSLKRDALEALTAEFMGLVHEHPGVLVQLYKLAVQRDEETTSIMEEEVSVAEDFVLS